MRYCKSLAASVAALGLLALAAPANAVRYDAVVDGTLTSATGQFGAGLGGQRIQIIWQINSGAPGAILSNSMAPRDPSSSLSGEARQGRSGAVNAIVLLPQSQNFDLGLSGDSTGRAVESYIKRSRSGYSYQDTSRYISRNPDGGGYQRELFVNFEYTNKFSAVTLSDFDILTPDRDIYLDGDVLNRNGTFRYIITDYDRLGNPTPHVFYDLSFAIEHISFHAIPTVPEPPAATVPEPGTWALMIAGFGLAGTALRRRRRAAEQHAG